GHERAAVLSGADRRHRSEAGNRLPLLHRLRAMGVLVGRRLDDRGPPRGAALHASPQRCGDRGRGPGGAPPERIVFTYGLGGGRPIPPGSSRVTIRLAPHRRGTELTLAHEFAEASARAEHVQGWRYQLAVFGNVVADELHRDAAGRVDGWFRGWSAQTDALAEEALARVASPDV